jgi:hypothetical protein
MHLEMLGGQENVVRDHPGPLGRVIVGGDGHMELIGQLPRNRHPSELGSGETKEGRL